MAVAPDSPQNDDEDPIVSYGVSNYPAHGALSGTAPNLIYTPASGFTGNDSFTYAVSAGFDYSDAATVSIVVGDQSLYANEQSPLTGTNQPLRITLTAGDTGDTCIDTNFTFTVESGSGPSFGSLTGAPPNLIYTPDNGFEGIDSFYFTAGDGAWAAGNSVTIYVVAGPELAASCRYDQIALNWSLDDAVQEMEGEGLTISNYQVYRSTNSGGPYNLIYTTTDATQTNYVDVAVSQNTTYYYVVDFQYLDPSTGITYQSPLANEASAAPCNLPSPLRPGFNQNVLAPNDDDCYIVDGYDPSKLLTNLLATIGFPVSFFGNTYTTLFVNNNGNVSFGNFLADYTPTNLLAEVSGEAGSGITVIIAPFWADVDTRGSDSGLVTYGTNLVGTNAAFAASWIDVGYFYEADDKLNVFQLVIINRPDRATGDYDLEFDYTQIQWETGDASGGTDGLGGYSARAGYASVSGASFEMKDSGTNGAFLDANLTTGLKYGSFNSSTQGRYVFPFHNGTNSLHP